MNLLYETSELRLEHQYESTYLVDKKSGAVLCEDEFYGDPTCGLISPANDWAIVAGEHLCIWTRQKTQRIVDEHLKWVYAMRTKNSMTVEILTDPWSQKSAIWKLDLQNLRFEKISTFTKYQGTEYTESVIW